MFSARINKLDWVDNYFIITDLETRVRFRLTTTSFSLQTFNKQASLFKDHSTLKIEREIEKGKESQIKKGVTRATYLIKFISFCFCSQFIILRHGTFLWVCITCRTSIIQLNISYSKHKARKKQSCVERKKGRRERHT